ncbi:MAG: MATE family efflux transporter [Planctomycetes bacterium]|nr:MATE family efflux transporter [Planctomycetota bacterium]
MSSGEVTIIPFRSYLRKTLALAVPIVVVQVGSHMIGLVDVMMTGRYSGEALAAAGVANIGFFTIYLFGLGLMLALDPFVSQAFGAGDRKAAAVSVQRSIVVATTFSFLMMIALWFFEPVLGLFSVNEKLIPHVMDYLYATIPGVLPFVLFLVIRQTAFAHSRTREIVATIIIANVANVIFNYALIFGNFGCPELGVAGAGYASTLCRYVMFFVLLWLEWPKFIPLAFPLQREAITLGGILTFLRTGLPLAIQTVLEVGTFSIVGLWMARLPNYEAAVGAHMVSINTAAMTFMVPLGISGAAGVLVGQAVGRGDHRAMVQSAKAALLLSVIFMSTTCLILLSFPFYISKLYTSEEEIIAFAISILPIAGVFQIFDGLQVVSAGILRGIADTKVPMLLFLASFWFCGLPVSYFLCFEYGYGPAGLWWGLVVGLVVISSLLLIRVRVKLSKPVWHGRLIRDFMKSVENDTHGQDDRATVVEPVAETVKN